MNPQRDVDLINELLAIGSETSWLEFKKDNVDPDSIGVRCSALANAARLAGKDRAYMLWGVEDQSLRVIGTVFNPDTQKAHGQELAFWLARQLQPSVAFEFRTVVHPDGQIRLLEIPAATSAPVAFKNIPYIRIGSATPKLTDYPERYQQLIEKLRPYTWEHALARQYATGDEVLELLDYSSYFKLTRQPLPDNRAGIFEKLSAEGLIGKDVGDKWNITNLGAILFGSNLAAFNSSLARKAVRFIAYGGRNRAATVTHRADGNKGYAIGFEGLIEFINGLLPKNEHIDTALRTEQPLFPTIAVRELIANALIHQDMTISGAGPQIEVFVDRMEITNPGKPLVPTERMIDLPPRSRNEALAALMRRMGMCEEQGSGLDKVIASVELFQLPPPLFREEGDAMQVVLYGPRTFAQMTPDERTRACYHHSILKFLSGERMKNATLCERFGIESRNASQASGVLKKALEAGLIRAADPEHPRAGYVPWWA
ncbi:ATP-binding protein [Ectothiorhodospira shaposhnikovii]|uniref:ATP-binding protein n=3 Tax=Ectothiorhodospira TaxID=1051 RepID=UPI001EE80EBA|nr:ATP-binding protein [Ectothiorhodospira shaposhnikovii]MCG5512465.1 putative DNA binding domain-containing protein [Ectothiorhodospira shaposhnikovii]